MTGMLRHFPRLALGIAALLLLILPILGLIVGEDMSYFARDPAALGNLKPYAGALSNLGVLAWAGSFFVGAFAAASLQARGAHRDRASYLLSLGLLSMFLCVDDLFMIHEGFPGGEFIIYGIYALSLLAILILHKAAVKASPHRYAVIALVFLLASLAVDVVQDQVQAIFGEYRILLEDGFKFLGAVALLGYLWQSGIAFNLRHDAGADPARPHSRDA